MPQYKKGTLVRIKPEEESEGWGIDETDNVVREHGWIFQIIRFHHERHPKNATGENEYLCKSIASGQEVCLFPREITTKEQDQ